MTAVSDAAKANAREYMRKRGLRKRLVRARSITTSRLPKWMVEEMREENADVTEQRPATRAGCLDVGRPCPFVSCKHHLFVDVSPRTGSIKLNFPDLDSWQLRETCALDVAARGGATLEVVAELMNITRERCRQIEEAALAKLAAVMPKEIA